MAGACGLDPGGDLHHGPRGQDIANGLGRQTVAEFVPDDATIALLLRHGVHLGQGYHLGRPAPLADLLAQAPDCLRA